MPPKPLRGEEVVASQEKKAKLQQALACFKEGMKLIKGAVSRKELQDGVDQLSLAISLRPSVFR
jgi:hypothetical protein